jgi:hypothetical protein
MIGTAVAIKPHNISGCTNFISAAKITGGPVYRDMGFGKMVNQKEKRMKNDSEKAFHSPFSILLR